MGVTGVNPRSRRGFFLVTGDGEVVVGRAKSEILVVT